MTQGSQFLHFGIWGASRVRARPADQMLLAFCTGVLQRVALLRLNPKKSFIIILFIYLRKYTL